MAALLAGDHPSLASQDDDAQDNDPFFSSSTSSNSHRFSHFNSQLFALGPTTSPEQAKRALEAHLAETERRIQDASRLGTTLVQQRKDLTDRLKDVEKQQSEEDITPELRQKLADIEKEYNEVGRESARTFLPKSRVSSSELAGSPFGETKRSASPSKFESQATASPSKLSVPTSRKQRNQPSNRVHDIEFVTEISTSLLSQVRHLQALLAEKEESLKAVTLEKSRLEIEAEGFHQHLRALDDSEQRYKDENWNLETQIHEHIAAAKEAASREKKLTQNLNIVQVEKSAAQKELDEIKLSHAKLSEEHVAAIKHHDVELGGAKRSITMAENERGALQRKIEDLTGQNTELAKAVAHQRGRLEDSDQVRRLSDEDFEAANDDNTPEHSPPPSPIKGTPRHSMLESETLKSSLHHAHRMIQNLKGNIHREKTEKLELKRMLQDARDELDARRSESGMGSAKRSRKIASREFKKPLKPAQLGGLRNSRSEVYIEDPNWEDDGDQPSPSRSTGGNAPHQSSGLETISSHLDSSDHFETANETSDANFETANERATETEDFQTGVEEMSGSDELTETEDSAVGTLRSKPAPLSLYQIGNRQSFQSTASTSGGEDYDYDEIKTPTNQPQPPRLRLKVSRGGNRRSRTVSEEPSFRSSPASFAQNSREGTPQAPSQSLFAELGDMSDEDESIIGTPGPSAVNSPVGTPVASRPNTARNTSAVSFSISPVRKITMVDSGTMTEPWEPGPLTLQTAVPLLAKGAAAGVGFAGALSMMHDMRTSTGTQVELDAAGVVSQASTGTQAAVENADAASQWHDERSSTGTQVFIETKDAESQASPIPEIPIEMSDAASQWHEEQLDSLLNAEPLEDLRPVSISTYSDRSSQYEPTMMDEKLASFPSPPTSRAETVVQMIPISLTLSTIYSEHVEPTEPEVKEQSPVTPKVTRQIEPITPKLASIPPPLAISSIHSIDTEPIEALSPRSPKRNAVIIPRDNSDDEATKPEVGENASMSLGTALTSVPVEEVVDTTLAEPQTSKPSLLTSVFGKKSKRPATPIIAGDDTRQSLSDSPRIETSESQQPFKGLSSTTNDRAIKKPPVEMADESSQTSLTAGQIDEMLRVKRQAAILAEDGSKLPTSPRGASGLRARKSQDSIGSVGHAKSKTNDPETPHEIAPILKRPSSSRNGSMSSTHPPLPADSMQVIAAAAQRSGSSTGAPASLVAQRSGSSTGAMGPPLFPASAYRNNLSLRPHTPSSPFKSPSLRDGTTPRPTHSSSGAAVQSPPGTARSRRSSVSSFASELENRFNIRGVTLPSGMDSNTDPRMINAITQTMIGEYLWKYTRKAGRGAMSENRHRRYFWVHPYTRTLYWSDRDPSQAGRTELKAKSVPIEAVRVVTDDNPMPPGLHRKSLIIMTPGRAVKFTATTGQRHETWFNALSYLLLRTGEDPETDTSEVVHGLTSEDVAEFNPGYGNSSTHRGPSSLSSYNSRTTRNESPGRKSSRLSMHPQLAKDSSASRSAMGTFSRLSSYWMPGKDSAKGSTRSRQSIGGTGGSIYEASEVHDSAEDLREMIEKQDRESDKLENVRACCDGKHDVGHLHSSTKGRHSHSNTLGAASGSRSAGQRAKSRTSVMRRTD